jgi:hypothetical protein
MEPTKSFFFVHFVNTRLDALPGPHGPAGVRRFVEFDPEVKALWGQTPGAFAPAALACFRAAFEQNVLEEFGCPLAHIDAMVLCKGEMQFWNGISNKEILIFENLLILQ